MLFEFFSPPERKHFESESFSPTQIGANILLSDGKKVDLHEFDLAIIGVPDDRQSCKNKGSADGPDILRAELYKLHIPSVEKTIRILDLGNIIKGETPRDTHFALASSVLELITHKVVPIILGGSHDNTYGQYLSYQELYALVNLVVVDEQIDINEDEESNTNNSSSFLSNILVHNPNYLFNLAQIGYQTYLNNPFAIDMLESLNFDCVRLGLARKNIEHLEPILRDADLVSIDISSIRMSDAPAHANASPNGFSGEELCQIARYAGISDKLTSFGIYEFNPASDIRNQTAKLLAQTIWCFIDGYYNRRNDHPADKESFLKFTVKMDELDHEIVFWKSKMTDRWWMELPFGDKQKFARQQMVPCTYQDYEMACREEIPDRWMKVYNKLMEDI